MMELVDMQGLKPCPIQGPGSSPGAGNMFVGFLMIIVINLYIVIIYQWNCLYLIPVFFFSKRI